MIYCRTKVGSNRQNIKNGKAWRTVAAVSAPKTTRNSRRSNRQAIARLAENIPQPVAGERYRARHWLRLVMRTAR